MSYIDHRRHLNHERGEHCQRRSLRHVTYQTKPNPSRHSNSSLPRHTLMELSILRTLLMVRTALISILLGALIVLPASAVRIQSPKARAHATAGVSAHKTHRSSASHSTQTTSGHAASHAGHHSARYSSASTPRSTRSTPSRRRRYGYSHPAVAMARRISVSRYRATPRSVPPGSAEEVDSAAVVKPSVAAEPAAADSAAPEDFSSEAPAKEVPNPAELSTTTSINTPDREIEEPAIPVPSAIVPSQTASLHRPGSIFASPLRGTHDSLVRQNVKEEADDLERIEDDADLHDRIARGVLVPVPESALLAVNGNLPADRRYCRPWTATFLADLARDHHAEFHTPIEVSSAVRTVDYQKRLMRTNGNAAAAEGDIVSPHVTGAAVDIAKGTMNYREILWMRNHLLLLQNEGKIDVEEEFRQACFHITVYKSYVPERPAQKPRRRAVHPPAENTDTTEDPADVATGAS
jgi:hypothetical protein